MKEIVMRGLMMLIASLCLAVSGTGLGGCTTNPATGKTQLDLLSLEQQIALGEEAMPALVEEYGGAYGGAGTQAYVTEIGTRLAATTEAEYPRLPWEFTLLDSEVINAFALPGGKVFVSAGLVSMLDNEAELAAVLGHEIGHVTAEHVSSRMSQQLLVAGLATAAGVAAGQADEQWVRQAVPVVVGVGGAGYLLKFGRDQELEADSLGMRYATRAGYEPEGLLGVLEVLADASEGSPQLEIFSTHPAPERRLEHARAELTSTYRGVDGALNRSRFRDEFSRLIARLRPAEGGRLVAASWCGVCSGQGESDSASNTVRAALVAE
jgi:predicted Zn-dependent protease